MGGCRIFVLAISTFLLTSGNLVFIVPWYNRYTTFFANTQKIIAMFIARGMVKYTTLQSTSDRQHVHHSIYYYYVYSIMTHDIGFVLGR